MNARTLLALGLLTVTPSLSAQTYPEPPVPTSPRPAIVVAAEAPVPPPTPEAAQAPPAPKVAPAPVAPVAPAMALAPPKPLGQLLNVQIEVTLSDSKGTPKTVALTVADGELGQNRTNSAMQVGTGYQNYQFNADGRPTISGNKIRLYLSAEATVPAFDAKGSSAANIQLRQSQTMILNDGDSVEIARATDPVSERAFTLSVKVKIQR